MNDKDSKIFEDWKLGLSFEELSKKYDAPLDHVYFVIQQATKPERQVKKKKELTDAILEEIQEKAVSQVEEKTNTRRENFIPYHKFLVNKIAENLKGKFLGIHSGSGKPKINLPIDEIISLYNQGQSLREIANKFGVSVKVIYGRLRRSGIKMRSISEAKTKNLPIDEIISLYDQGQTLQEIANKFGVNFDSILRRLKLSGVKTRSSGEARTKSLPIDEIISLYNQGWSAKKIANKFGVGSGTILKRLATAEVKIRQGEKYREKDLPIDEIIFLYDKGWSSHKIANKFGVSNQTILSKLRAAETKIRSRGGYNKIDLPLDEIISLYNQGWGSEKIAEKFGVDGGAILRKLKSAGIKIRPKGSRKKENPVTRKNPKKLGQAVKELFAEMLCDEINRYAGKELAFVDENNPTCVYVSAEDSSAKKSKAGGLPLADYYAVRFNLETMEEEDIGPWIDPNLEKMARKLDKDAYFDWVSPGQIFCCF